MKISLSKKIMYVFILFLSLFLFVGTTKINSVSALRCKKTSQGNCGWADWYKDPKVCSSYDPGSRRMCCFFKPSGACAKVPYRPPCGNCFYVCPNPPCDCTPHSCPPEGGNKFMTKRVKSGVGNTCSGAHDCTPNTFDCYKKVNTPPTCNIIPQSISTTRTAAPKTFALTVTDNDYGDTVKVKGVRVVDSHGNLKSCVNVTTLSGGLLDNLIVKTGSNNPSSISQRNILQIDARSAYGIYDSIGNGISECSGIIEIEIADVDSDGSGSDVSDYTTCTLNVSVINNNPVISNIVLNDHDANSQMRRQGNLVHEFGGNDPLPVGSLFDANRVASCSSAVALNGDTGSCSNWVPQKTRTNPYKLSFRVTDKEGYKDIKDIGFWVQKSNSTARPKVPLITSAGRQSIQALIGQRKDYNIPISTNNKYLTSAPCIGNICTRDILSERLLSYSLITESLSASSSGKISASHRRSAGYRSWLQVGFPNCLFTASGCNSQNVPAMAKQNATSDTSRFYNYNWMIAADKRHMLCLSSTSNTSKTIPASAICPSSCAACVILDKLDRVPNNLTSIDVSFVIYMNDKFIDSGNGQGMAEGRYEVMVGSRDTVNGLAHGSRFWESIEKDANSTFSLNFDAHPPQIMSFGLTEQVNAGVASIRSFGQIRDASPSPSGVAGWGTRYLMQEEYEGPNILSGEISFLNKVNNTISPWDGADDFIDNVHLDQHGTFRFSYTGYGIDPSAQATIGAGLCTYDKAGNMCCAQRMKVNGQITVTKACSNYGDSGSIVTNAPWMQTLIGSVYSNSRSNAFKMYVPGSSRMTLMNDDETKVSLPYAPFKNQSGSAISGMLISGGSAAGITGGREFDYVQYPLGFSNNSTSIGNYRKADSSNPNNIYNIKVLEERSWYGILYSTIRNNCAISNECYTEPSSGSNLAFINAKNNSQNGYVVIDSDEKFMDPLLCRGANVIFITNGATVQVTEVNKVDVKSGCIFVVDDGATLKLTDWDFKNTTNSGVPGVDRFESAIVVSKGGSFISENRDSIRNVIYDRLQINGFIYSDSILKFERTLRNEDNKDYPAEWFLYDANLLDIFRNMLGTHKIVDMVCGTSDNILCTAETQ